MTFIYALIPLYLLGNFHCLGMCGPLVMLLARHKYRYYYFIGRTLSFSLAGLLSSELGVIVTSLFKSSYVSPVLSLLFGSSIIFFGILTFLRISYPGQSWLARRSAPLSLKLGNLMSKDKILPTFLFGFFTIALPCGQTIVVFSLSALTLNPLFGLLNGLLFALLTSPSLFFAMHAAKFLNSRTKKSYHIIIGVIQILIGALATFRGCADLNIIPHWILNPHASSEYHIVFF